MLHIRPQHDSQRRDPQDRRAGFTLIELLVVVLIVMILAAVALPVLAPALDGRRTREASRLVTAYFAGARYRDEKRPCSRRDDRALHRTDRWLAAKDVDQAFDGRSAAALHGRHDYVVRERLYGAGTVQLCPADVQGWIGAVRPGDIIKFNLVGHSYQLQATVPAPTPPQLDVNGFFTLTGPSPWIIVPLGASYNGVPTYSAATTNTVPNLSGVSYQIFRQPVKSANPPLVLPESIVVDLDCSGTDFIASFTGTNPVIITFSPDGSLGWMYANGIPLRPTGPIYLHLGKRENIGSTTSVGGNVGGPFLAPANCLDVTNLWITIHPQSGLITSTEVANVSASSQPNMTVSQVLAASRQFALEGRAMGGR